MKNYQMVKKAISKRAGEWRASSNWQYRREGHWHGARWRMKEKADAMRPVIHAWFCECRIPIRERYVPYQYEAEMEEHE